MDSTNTGKNNFQLVSQDVSDSFLENFLLKKIFTDKNWASLMVEIFDTRFIKTTPFLDKFIYGVLLYFKKYSVIPSLDIAKELFIKYVEKYPDKKINPVEVFASVDLAMNKITLDMLADDVLVENLKFYIRKQALWCAIIDNVDDINSDKKSSTNVIDSVLTRFDRVNKITFDDSNIGFNYFSSEDMAAHWDRLLAKDNKIPTGWPSLDTYTNGGFLLNGKSLYIFMGQAGLGKSLFLSNLAVNFLKENKSVVVISLEMSEDIYGTRFDAHISDMDINQLQENQDTVIEKLKRFKEKYPESNLYIKEFPPKTITVPQIEAYLERLKTLNKQFDVIIIDYLNLIKNSQHEEGLYQSGLEVSEKLRALSYKYSVPVITATQTNTEGMNNEEVGMQHISESRGIAHTADFIGALFQTEEAREDGIINMRIIKNRLGGQIGKILNFKVNPESLRLTDISLVNTQKDQTTQIENFIDAKIQKDSEILLT